MAGCGHRGAGRVGHHAAPQAGSAVSRRRHLGPFTWKYKRVFRRPSCVVSQHTIQTRELDMKKIRHRIAPCALAIAFTAPLAAAQSQATSLQAAFGEDAVTLSDKFTGL